MKANQENDHTIVQHFSRRFFFWYRELSALPKTDKDCFSESFFPTVFSDCFFSLLLHGHKKPSAGTSAALDHRVLQHLLRRSRICRRLVFGPGRNAILQKHHISETHFLLFSFFIFLIFVFLLFHTFFFFFSRPRPRPQPRPRPRPRGSRDTPRGTQEEYMASTYTQGICNVMIRKLILKILSM